MHSGKKNKIIRSTSWVYLNYFKHKPQYLNQINWFN